MHCQHVKGYSPVLSNFDFLPHMLQQQVIGRCFDFKNIFQSTAAAIPLRQMQLDGYKLTLTLGRGYFSL
jgi:hypothetical protein